MSEVFIVFKQKRKIFYHHHHPYEKQDDDEIFMYFTFYLPKKIFCPFLNESQRFLTADTNDLFDGMSIKYSSENSFKESGISEKPFQSWDS